MMRDQSLVMGNKPAAFLLGALSVHLHQDPPGLPVDKKMKDESEI